MKKFKILYKSFQIISFKKKNCDIEQVFYCGDGEYRVYCSICDKLCKERFYENHLKSRTHTNNIRKREQLKNHFK